jgi:hypothetical protein
MARLFSTFQLAVVTLLLFFIYRAKAIPKHFLTTGFVVFIFITNRTLVNDFVSKSDNGFFKYYS